MTHPMRSPKLCASQNASRSRSMISSAPPVHAAAVQRRASERLVARFARQATAIGNSLNVMVVGSHNTTVVDTTQINNGNQTATAALNSH